jgi:hypothetical protein
MIRVTFFRHTLVIYIETIMTLTTMGDNSFKPYFNDNIVFNCNVRYLGLATEISKKVFTGILTF